MSPTAASTSTGTPSGKVRACGDGGVAGASVGVATTFIQAERVATVTRPHYAGPVHIPLPQLESSLAGAEDADDHRPVTLGAADGLDR